MGQERDPLYIYISVFKKKKNTRKRKWNSIVTEGNLNAFIRDFNLTLIYTILV